MRKLPAIATFLTLLAAASSSYADDAKPTTDSSSAAPKKVAKRGKKKKPAAAPVAEDAAATTPAPEPAAQPVVTAAAPAPAPAPAPVAAAPAGQTSTTSADLSRRERDRLKDEEDPVPPISAAPLLGIATNNLGFGLGARVGYTLPMKLYVGGQFMYHFGTSPVPEVSVSAFYPSAEVGYEFRPVNGLMVRPYGGIGMMFTSVSASNGLVGLGGADYSAHGHSFVFYPACTVTYTIPKTDVFVGGDARLLLATGYSGYDGTGGLGTSFGVFATAGMRF